GLGVFGRVGLLLFSQLLELFAYPIELTLSERLFEVDDLGLNAGAAEDHLRSAIDKLAADGDLDRRALPSTGRIHVADMWRDLLGRESGRQSRGQPKETPADHKISFNRPPEGTLSSADGSTFAIWPMGCGSFASRSMPSS